MFHIYRVESLIDIFKNYKFVTLIGAGGKTSLSEYISKVYLEKGFNPVITVTTKIYACEPFLLERDIDEKVLSSRSFFRLGGDLKDGKLLGVREETIKTLGDFYDIVLIEADGSMGRPLKYCGPNEPVIPDFTDLVIVTCGLDGLGKPLRDVVFRWELSEKRGSTLGSEIVDTKRFLEIFFEGMLKVKKDMNYAICLNKYDLMPEKYKIWEILRNLSKNVHALFFLVSSVKYGIFYAFEYQKG